MKQKIWSRAAALVMTICMAITMVPSVALAAEPTGSGKSANDPLAVSGEALVYDTSKGIVGFSKTWYDSVNLKGDTLYVSLTIPAEIGNVPVTEIAYQALQYKNNGFRNEPGVLKDGLAKIKIVSVDFSRAKNLKIIGDFAFDQRTELTGRIDLSHTQVTKVGAGAFRKTGITGVILPDDLMELGDVNSQAGTFAECKQLQFIRTASSQNSEQAVVLPESLTTVGKQCFRYSFARPVNMVVPASVATVGAEAFNSNNIMQLNVLHSGDFSGYDKYAFQRKTGHLEIFQSAADYTAACNQSYSDYRKNMAYELLVNFKVNDVPLETQRKLYNQYFLYEKDETGIWAQNEEYQFPSGDMAAGYEYDWKYENNGESVKADSKVNDGTTAPTSIDVVAEGRKLTPPQITIGSPNAYVDQDGDYYVHEDGSITLKGVISNKVDGLHYDMAWAIYNWTTGNWETLPNETSDTLTVTKGGTYNDPCCYLFVCEAYDGKGVRSEQGGDYVYVYSAAHQWAYTAGGNTVTAACTQKNGTCPYAGRELKLTLTAPDAIANGQSYAGAKTANTITVATKEREGNINYEGVDGTTYTKSETAPTAAGTYKATVTIGGATAEQVFHIYNVSDAYTVTFKTNGGTEIAPLVKQNGTLLAAAEAVTTRKKYIFDGWYKDTTLETAWNYETDHVTSNITLYAKWVLAGKIETDVTIDANTPKTTVSGLDELAKAEKYQPNDADVVRIVLNVAAKEESVLPTETVSAIKKLSGSETLSYLEMHINHFINNNQQPDITDTTPYVQSITVEYDTAGKNISVYRVHNGTASKLAVAGSTPADGTYRVNDGSVTIYATKFSTYAIGYTTRSSGGHGSSTATTYPVSVNPVTNGTIKADKSSAAKGSTVTITVTPDKGYNLDKLTVTDKDGKVLSLTSKGNGQYSFTMPAGKVTVAAGFAETDWDLGYRNCPKDSTCPIWPYTDAETTAWYHDGVHFCQENGLMVGYGNNIFQPDTSTSRAMLSVMLWRLSGSPVVNYAMTFQDVAADSWYGEAVRWAASEGIVTGYDAQTFGPDNNVTREQMVTILYRYAQTKGYDVSVGESTNILSYDDAASVAQYAVPAMQWACGSGMVQGSDNKLAPQGSTTRAQMATMMMRFCAEIVK